MNSLSPISAQVQPAPSARLPYMVQLDALRALAVFAVIYFHYLPNYQGFFHWGDWGVRLFFVLSGFLITGILLKCRDLKESVNKTSNRVTKRQVHPLKQFYIRRSLRIFPLFYLVVLATALLNVKPARDLLIWNLTYTSNFYFALKGSWGGPISHFWSLAVEEQFYLLWPFLILYLPRKHLAKFILGAVCLSPIYQISGFYAGLNGKFLSITMLACLIYLAMGGLLANFRFESPEKYKNLASLSAYNWAGLFLFGAMIATSLIPNYLLKLTASSVATALFFTWLIHKASVGFRGPAGKLLEWKPLLFIGSISYGIYVYHNLIPVIVPRIFSVLHLPYPQNVFAHALVSLVLTLIVATLSYLLFERPINNLKRYFEYSKESH